MSELPSSAALQELMRYGLEHGRATLMLRQAAQDYAGARCLLLNGLFTGLVQGAQTIEKSLKGYLLLNDPKLNVKRMSHSLPTLLQEADALYPQLGLSKFAPLVEKFRRHYETRYPDNADASTTMTTGDLRELDEIVVFLNENMPCPRNVKYRTGMYALITFSLGYHATVPPWELWIKTGNQALVPLLPRINADYASVKKELYPS